MAKTVRTVYDEKDVEDNRGYAVLAYFWLLCLVPLLARPTSAYAQFHAKQGVVLAAAWFVVSVLQVIPILGQLLALAVFVVNMMAIIKTWNGEAWEIPYLYDWAQKLRL